MTLDATRRPTDAERIDQAVAALLDGTSAAVPPALAAELATAHAVRAGLPLIPAGARFEAQLARQLGAVPDRRLAGFVRQHQRLVLTGAVGSVVVSTASVAVVAWRVVHRTP
ncbi:MAG TPA: hypothetical protein VGO32_07995 [Candidatus Limnocylindria bacterium]|jgi:hypothetical protein|nr:hypothetical protein [Candidatus Limnocylindria bacterium]